MTLEDDLHVQRGTVGRSLLAGDVFRRKLIRIEHGRPDLEITRRIAPPDRYRDDVAVDGTWRYTEAFDGQRAWTHEAGDATGRQTSGPTLGYLKWQAIRLDYLQPLIDLRSAGCVLHDLGAMAAADGRRGRGVQVSLSDQFADIVFLDEQHRMTGHHRHLPTSPEGTRELEVRFDEWGTSGGLIHPIRSTVIDRELGVSVAEIRVLGATVEPYDPAIFELTTE